MSSSELLYMSGSLSSANMSSGKTKTDQVVLECVYKIAEVVIQCRGNSHNEAESGNRRARFNLDVDEILSVRRKLSRWKTEPHVPLYMDIFWDNHQHTRNSTNSRDPNSTSSISDDDSSNVILLERWVIHYVAQTGLMDGSTNVIVQLRQVCKKIGVLLRAIFSFVRLMPAHQLYLRSKSAASMGMGSLLYGGDTNHGGTLAMSNDVATSRYTFVPIETPFGLLKVSTTYRRDCSFAVEPCTSPILMPTIIQDYVRRDNQELSDSKQQRSLKSRPDTEDEGEEGTFLEQCLRTPTQENEIRDRAGSLPMAIPQSKHHAKPVSTLDSVYSRTDIGKAPMPTTNTRKPHAHSFGEADHFMTPDEPNAVASSPHWYHPIAAPYGYGNVKDSHKKEDKLAVDSPPSHTRSFDPRFIPPRHPNTFQKNGSAFGDSPAESSRRRYRKSSGEDLSSMEGLVGDGKMIRYPSGNLKYVEDSSPLMTPPFSFSSSLNNPSPFSLEMPIFGTSPPFLSNPEKLLSGSPQQSNLSLALSASPQETQNRLSSNSSLTFSTSLWGIGHSTPGHSLSVSMEDEQLPPFAFAPEEGQSYTSSNTNDQSQIQTNTASLGSFVQQMKTAPPLLLFSSRKSSTSSSPSSTFQSVEDELDKFRRLRDELSRK